MHKAFSSNNIKRRTSNKTYDMRTVTVCFRDGRYAMAPTTILFDAVKYEN